MSLRVTNTSEIDVEHDALLDKDVTTVPKRQSKLRTALLSLVDHIESHLNALTDVPYKIKRVIHQVQNVHYLLYGTLGIYMIILLIQSGSSKQYLSAKESHGLLQVPDDEWSRLKSLYERTERHKVDKELFIDDPNVWYQYNYPVDFVCPNAERIGKISGGSQTDRNENYDGYLGDGKWVCNPRGIVDAIRQRMKRTRFQNFREFFGHKYREKNGCLIYSIGVNGNGLHFETGIQRILTEEAGTCKKKGHKSCKQFCDIHVFDPAGYHEQVLMGDGIHYHDFGIVSSVSEAKSADSAGSESNKGAPVLEQRREHFKSFQEAVKELGHEGHVVDVMKVDCKMCEWGIYDDWFDRDDPNRESHRGHGRAGLSAIQQLLVEVHGTPQEYVNDFFERMEEENYVIFHKDADTQTFQGMSQDYAFLKLDKGFFP